MKKIILLSIFSLSLFSGEINDKFNSINKDTNQLNRIEAKLDLLLSPIIKEELLKEESKLYLKNVINDSKETIYKGADWISKKLKPVEEQ